MQMVPVVIGSRGRIVLPLEVRRALGLQQGDTIFFVLNGDEVKVSRAAEDFGEYLALYGGGPQAEEEGP